MNNSRNSAPTENSGARHALPCGKNLAPLILGMEDAIVEMTGALAGFTIALGNNRLIALAGLTTGFAATLSMGASEFLSQEADTGRKKPWVAAAVCGSAYLFTIAILLTPFFLLDTPHSALIGCLILAAIIILFFTAIVSRARKTRFSIYFIKMLSISFFVAGAAFALTWVARSLWGLDV